MLFNWLIPLPFVDGISPICVFVFDRNDDGIFENVLSNKEWPSEEPLLIIAERSFSDIVRVNNDDCWDTIAGSIAFDDNKDGSRGMLQFGKPDPDPEPEYNDGSVIAVDEGLICDILFRMCWDNIP